VGSRAARARWYRGGRAMPRYLQRIERPWFRRAAGLIETLN
jgi:hypothetical protein